MRIIGFDSDPDLLQRFLAFPRLHYASDANWFPDRSEARLLDPSRLATAGAVWHNFVAVEPDSDRIAGRITAILNQRLIDETGQPFGQLGFFECADDLPTARALVEVALAWLRVHSPSTQTVLAPMNFDTWHAYRLRVSGFDQPAFAMEPYNPPYYPALLEALGFTPHTFFVTKTVVEPASLLEAWQPHHTAALARGFAFRPLNPAVLAEELSLIYRLSLAVFGDNLFFAHIPEAEFASLYAGAGATLEPEMFLFVLDSAGEPAGFSFSFPDQRRRDTANLKTFGVLPRWRNIGLGVALAHEVYQRLVRKGFARINHCLMREGNRADQFDRGAAAVTRRYALYSQPLTVPTTLAGSIR